MTVTTTLFNLFSLPRTKKPTKVLPIQPVSEPDVVQQPEEPRLNVGKEQKALEPDRMAYALPSLSIDETRPMKVVIVGAGYSGITAGIRFRQKVKNLTMQIYDSSLGVGGTWWLNRYPGLACDIPSHAYQLTFEDNPYWSAFFSTGPEIRDYLNGVVDKYKLREYIKLQHRIVRAEWNAAEGRWHLTIRRPRLPADAPASEQSSEPAESKVYWDWKAEGAYEEFEDTADVLFTGLGPLSRWSWPDIEGLRDFKGELLHSAQWDEDGKGWQEHTEDWGDKRVGVIGVGSSAIQMVAALQPRVKHLVNYVRGKTWVTSSFLKPQMAALSKGADVQNYQFTEEDKERFSDPAYYKTFRWELESAVNGGFPLTIRGTEMSAGGKKEFQEEMLRRLAKKPWIVDHILPDFSPVCRRITPGPGYLEALCEDNVDFCPTAISKITEDGIETVDGKKEELDVIICATGFEPAFKNDFPIIGRNGVNLNDKYLPHPKTYLALTTDGFPNFFQCLGPNAGVGAGSLLIIMERQVEYAIQCTLKLQRERLKSMEVKKEAVDDFDEYLEHYFPTTVYSEKCRSWYKAGKDEGRIVAIWPGSPLHAIRALEHPRWEDYNYEYLDRSRNRFHWFGDGHTVADRDADGDKAFYLKEIDYPSIPQ